MCRPGPVFPHVSVPVLQVICAAFVRGVRPLLDVWSLFATFACAAAWCIIKMRRVVPVAAAAAAGVCLVVDSICVVPLSRVPFVGVRARAPSHSLS